MNRKQRIQQLTEKLERLENQQARYRTPGLSLEIKILKHRIQEMKNKE